MTVKLSITANAMTLNAVPAFMKIYTDAFFPQAGNSASAVVTVQQLYESFSGCEKGGFNRK